MWGITPYNKLKYCKMFVIVGESTNGTPHNTIFNIFYAKIAFMNNIIEVNLDDVLTGKVSAFPILDSKHISATISLYDIKLIDCNDYCQVYLYERKQAKNIKKDNQNELELTKAKMNNLVKNDIEVKTEAKLTNEIELRSIIRSKTECQRLAKANINDWKSFITLTFEENIQDVKIANKRFKYFIDKIRRKKSDLKYLCITEFQKRGAVHYHFLSNIDINDKNLIYCQEDNLNFKHIKYWNDGFTSVEEMKNDVKKIIGYIAKYMTKDIDKRLFSHHRYFYSQNLNKPIKNYINLDNKTEKDFYRKKIQEKELIYQNEYINPYNDEKVIFLEFLKK